MSWKRGKPPGKYTAKGGGKKERKGDCPVCNGKGTINKLDGTTVSCPANCEATRT